MVNEYADAKKLAELLVQAVVAGDDEEAEQCLKGVDLIARRWERCSAAELHQVKNALTDVIMGLASAWSKQDGTAPWQIVRAARESWTT